MNFNFTTPKNSKLPKKLIKKTRLSRPSRKSADELTANPFLCFATPTRFWFMKNSAWFWFQEGEKYSKYNQFNCPFYKLIPKEQNPIWYHCVSHIPLFAYARKPTKEYLALEAKYGNNDPASLSAAFASMKVSEIPAPRQDRWCGIDITNIIGPIGSRTLRSRS